MEGTHPCQAALELGTGGREGTLQEVRSGGRGTGRVCAETGGGAWNSSLGRLNWM